MVTKVQVMSALRKCFDPEINLNIVELGLIHEVKINKGEVNIKMGLTSPTCPLKSFILEEVKNKVSKIKGVKKINIDLVPGVWSPDRMSKKAKKKLGWY